MSYGYFILSLFIFSFTGLSYKLTGQTVYKIRQVTSGNYDNVVNGFTETGILYSSNKPNNSFLKYTDEENRNIFNMWEASVNDKAKLENARFFAPELRTPQHDGPASLNAERNLMVFTRNFTLKRIFNLRNENPRYGLFFADKQDGIWTNIREFEFNCTDCKTTHPSLTPDGKTLYFSSDRVGGFGGFDLYVSNYENGKWSDPENLGSKINTPKNDLYPYFHPSGRLYFSSEGHENAGGYDIYFTELFNDEYIIPVKLPSPVNSPFNDFTIILDDNFEKGFITSSRRGSLDIFMLELTSPSFDVCKQQITDNFCFVFFERNTMEIDTSLYRYVWDLGDGTKIESVEAEHCYSGPGTYIISLDVADVLTKEIMFNQAEYKLELKKTIQAFISCPDTLVVGQDFELNGYESNIGDVLPSHFYWDFGDGGRAVGSKTQHRYLTPGKFNVRLGIEAEPGLNEIPEKFCSFKNVTVLEP